MYQFVFEWRKPMASKKTITTAEFKAWMEGFEEALTGPPNHEQWKKIREMMKRIEDPPNGLTTIYRDYWPWTTRPWYDYPYRIYGTYGVTKAENIGLSAEGVGRQASTDNPITWTAVLDAAREAGVNDAMALTTVEAR